MLFTILLSAMNLFAQITLRGKVINFNDKSPLPGASIYFPDLKTGTSTNSDGSYQIKNLPKGKFSISVKYIGYNSINQTVLLEQDLMQDFELLEGVVESKEFIVTGVSQATERSRMPVPVSLVSKSVLLQNSASNIVEAISKQAGISQLSTGQGISKPIIRGLGYNRVVIVHDGIRQEGQQWGDEHGLELDDFSVNSVEILKGPASLSFGSDAMAGVVNFISAPSASNGEIKGELLGNYQSNNSLQGYSAYLSGNQNGFVWDARYSRKMAGNYQNKYDGKVYNSGFNENNLKGMLGLNRKWGYSHIIFSQYEMKVALPEGERDSLSGKFTREKVLSDSSTITEIVPAKDLLGYGLDIPQQSITHLKLVWDNNFVFNSSRISARLGYQENNRKEFGDINNVDLANLYFQLRTATADIRYHFPEKQGRTISFGISSMLQNSRNKGIEYLVPEYELADVGAFVMAKKSYDKLDISGGLRYDMRFQNGDALYLDSSGIKTSEGAGAQLLFPAFNSTFRGISGSLGATYQISKILIGKANISRGYRAPNIAELASNGAHEGTLRYELGDSKLKPENSLQFDFDVALNTEHFSFETDFFLNQIQNFIFPVKIAAVGGGDSISDGLSTYKFTSGNAQLMGGEITMDLHPHPFDWLHFENSFSLVQARQLNQPDSTKYLPFTPAPKLISELRADINNVGKFLSSFYVKLEVENYFAQNQLYAADGTERPTPGYSLLNIGFGGDIVNRNKKVICSIYFSGNNLTDVAFQSHLSRLKYAPENYATNRAGIFNMGRNFSVKLVVPIQIKSANKG